MVCDSNTYTETEGLSRDENARRKHWLSHVVAISHRLCMRSPEAFRKTEGIMVSWALVVLASA